MPRSASKPMRISAAMRAMRSSSVDEGRDARHLRAEELLVVGGRDAGVGL